MRSYLVTEKITNYTIDELMAFCLAKTIKEGDTVFNGVAVPLPFTAIMLARKTHAPNCVFWGGLPAGLNPEPCFLPPTSADSVMLREAEPVLHLSQIFDLVMRGELNRVFFSGAQIDKHGNLNNTLIGTPQKIRVKLPGGAGGSHVGSFAGNFTIWNVRHEARSTSKGVRMYNFVDRVDFITTMGLRTDKGDRRELGIRGAGPDVVVTNLCVFDFDEASSIMRLKSLHPGVSIQDVLDNTGFEPVIAGGLEETPPPTEEAIRIIRALDPLETRKRGFSSEALDKRYDL
jgi:glutaconate CoA-transferase subunit B